jgi:hypothetical protein
MFLFGPGAICLLRSSQRLLPCSLCCAISSTGAVCPRRNTFSSVAARIATDVITTGLRQLSGHGAVGENSQMPNHKPVHSDSIIRNIAVAFLMDCPSKQAKVGRIKLDHGPTGGFFKYSAGNYRGVLDLLGETPIRVTRQISIRSEIVEITADDSGPFINVLP